MANAAASSSCYHLSLTPLCNSTSPPKLRQLSTLSFPFNPLVSKPAQTSVTMRSFSLTPKLRANSDALDAVETLEPDVSGRMYCIALYGFCFFFFRSSLWNYRYIAGWRIGGFWNISSFRWFWCWEGEIKFPSLLHSRSFFYLLLDRWSWIIGGRKNGVAFLFEK